MADILSEKTHIKLPVVNFVLLIVAIAGMVWGSGTFLFSFRTDIKDNSNQISIIKSNVDAHDVGITGLWSSVNDNKDDTTAVATRVTVLEVQYNAIINNQERMLEYLENK
jgi:hypothetical protein